MEIYVTQFRLILTAALMSVFSMLPLSSFAKTPIYSTDNIAINGYDVVAYFTKQQAQQGNSEFSHNWQGVKWLFTSQKHRNMFIKSPENYVPLFGGFCGLGAAHGALVPSDPEAWTTHKGQLVLNQDKKVTETWLYNPDKNIQRAKHSYKKAIARYKQWQSKSKGESK